MVELPRGDFSPLCPGFSGMTDDEMENVAEQRISM